MAKSYGGDPNDIEAEGFYFNTRLNWIELWVKYPASGANPNVNAFGLYLDGFIERDSVPSSMTEKEFIAKWYTNYLSLCALRRTREGARTN